MKPDSDKPGRNPDQSRPADQASAQPGLERDDALWNLLGKASHRQPGAFFARNIIRETRHKESRTRRRRSGASRLFTPLRVSLGVAACACAMAAYHFLATPDPSPAPRLAAEKSQAGPSAALTELVILESLSAAAEDPTLFTRDEVVAMIGF